MKENFDRWKIPLYKIYTDEEDLQLITKIIKRGTQWALGPEIEEFENAIKEYVGTNYCVTLNSGTSALHALFLSYGIGQNDELIIPSFTFISTANSVLFVNAKPIFADIEKDTYGLDPKILSKKITTKTKAIVPIDYGGLSCKIKEIKHIANDNKILLIEDSAEALGAKVSGKKVGSLSDSAIFSFCGNKVLTTGEGGAVVTNSKKIFEKIKLLRSHGRIDDVPYFNNPNDPKYVGVGYNWRMSSLTAALGLSQLNKLDKIIKKRQQVAHYFSSHLKKYPDIIIPNTPEGSEHIYQMYTIRLKNNQIRNKLHKFLTEKRIFSKIYFQPIHLTLFYKNKFGYNEGSLPITEQISEQVLTLPIYPNMKTEEKKYLVESISEFFEVDT